MALRMSRLCNKYSQSVYFLRCHFSTEQRTTDVKEIDKFSRLSSHWWDTHGMFRALHSLNELRVPLIRDALHMSSGKPLNQANILDLGCGGGILTETLAKLGASVTGLDADEDGIRVAKAHISNDPILSKRNDTIENFSGFNAEKFDVVVASEIIEHVSDTSVFIKHASSVLKHGGAFVLTTINKTQLSYWLAIVGAEYIAGVVPKGTHDWHKFVKPARVTQLFYENGISTRQVHGMALNPVTKRWSFINCSLVNYAIVGVKENVLVRPMTVAEKLRTHLIPQDSLLSPTPHKSLPDT